jgi:outer membrane protein TolC
MDSTPLKKPFISGSTAPATAKTIARWRWARHCAIALTLAAWGGVGCSWNRAPSTVDLNNLREPQAAESVGQEFEYPEVNDPGSDDPASTPAPRSLSSAEPTDYWEMSLEEAIHYGLTNSKVLTDLGATVLRNPDSLQTNVTAAVTQTDPRFGIEGALSQFDTQFNFTSNFEKNDRAINNLFSAGGISARTFKQDVNVYRAEMVKRGATGSTMAVRNVTEYDFNNAPANLFPGAWTTYFEGEMRQPLLQGAGVEYNRIAGINGVAGLYNGVVVARLNADISQADFEIAMREYLSNVENAYWDLYFAYRDLDSKIAARDAALDTWRRLDAQAGKLPGSESFRLAQAREQYFKFEQDVQNALTGRRVEGTRSFNGSTGGTFRGGGGVYLSERRLRLLIGIPATDGRVVRATTEPSLVQVVHAWEPCKAEALSRRPELHKQRFRVKRSEMELTASRNFLKPKLDAVGRYRFRGFGQDLINQSNPDSSFDNAYGNLTTGDFQEWQMGFEFNMPLGFRQGVVAVRNAEFKLSRERAVLREQERQIVHDLSNAIADVDRAYDVAKLAYNRRQSAIENLEILRNNEQAGNRVSLDVLLEAQRRSAEADSQYHLAVIDYQVSIKNVNLEKGSLLEYHNIMASDGTSTTTMPDEYSEGVDPSTLPVGAGLAKETNVASTPGSRRGASSRIGEYDEGAE